MKKKVSHDGRKLRNLSALRDTSVKYLDMLEMSDELQQQTTLQKDLVNTRSQKPFYKEILNEIASARSLMLANTPKQ